MNISQEVCENGFNLSRNVVIKAILLGKSTICVFGLVVWVLFLIAKPWRLILHMNARALICYHAVLCCLLLSVNLPMHTAHLIRMFSSFPDKCDYLVPRRISFYFQFAAFSLIFFQAITNALFALERIACTINRKYYERREYPKTIAAVSVLVTAVLTYGLHEFLTEGINWDTRKLGFTTRDKNNQYATKTILIFIFCIEIITITSFQTVHFVNKRTRYRLRHGSSMSTFGCELSVKLQIRESITVTEMWTPIAAVHCLVFLIASVGLYINLWTVTDEILQVIIGESVSMNIAYSVFLPVYVVSMNIAYSVFLPVYVFAKNPSLFWEAIAIVSRNRIKRQVKTAADEKDEFTQYFDNLKVLFTQGSLDSAAEREQCWKFCCW
uniref:G_PROTEIN_RECEP_F1_2 domain-containing protein n=1 Tax=Steinernema glaseri TaxID=37863 RepID=A0A1I7ZMX8_9BILA